MANSVFKKLGCSTCPCCEKDEDDDSLTGYLYAFDFDHTIIDQNADTAVMEIIHDPIPESLVRLYDGSNWEDYMEKIFKFVQEEGGTYDIIAEKISKLKPTGGMITLLQNISASRSLHPRSRLIIVSDSNTFFIQTYMNSRTPPIVPDALITNSAEKTKEGYLKLKPFECQTSCPLCPRNLCKGRSLQKYIEYKGPFTKVYYTGDGGNDVCPAMSLNSNDVVFVRRNFAMDKIITLGFWKGVSIHIRAKIVYWDDAKEIEQEIQY